MSNEQVNTNPEGSGEKTFTQEEVNRIISDRLTQERRRSAAPKEDDREQALKAREARLDCREFLESKKLPSALLDVLDTSNIDDFKSKVALMEKAMPNVFVTITERGAQVVNPPHYDQPNTADALAAAFKPK